MKRMAHVDSFVRVLFVAGLVATAQTSVSPATASPISTSAAALVSTAFAAEGDAKIDEQVVAPADSGMIYYISPVGCNIVAVSPRGSRFVGIHNGVETAKYDKISNRVAFSPDGQRHAYMAKAGTDYVVIVDGKEAYRSPIGTNSTLANGAFPPVRFTPNSKHWYFTYWNNTDPDGADPNHVVWDGKRGPVYWQEPVTVSPDGERHAYIVTNPKTQKQTLIVDGQPAGYDAEVPQFSADGKYLYTQRALPPVNGRPVIEFLVNGKPFMRAERATINLPPAGGGMLAVVERFEKGVNTAFLVANNKKVEGSETQGYEKVFFSADGKHFAALSGQPGANAHLIVDGKKSQEYTSIDEVSFLPNGKIFFNARVGAKLFVIIGDEESDVAFNSLGVKPQFGGTRVGYFGNTDQNISAVVVDGKVTRLPRGQAVTDLKFSPDGSRYAYVIASAGFQSIAIDGKNDAAIGHRDFSALRAGIPLKFIWSPDNKYLLYFGAPGGITQAKENGFVLNDKFIPLGNTPAIGFPTFTPDGKHLFWLVPTGEFKVFLDGKEVYKFDSAGREPLTSPGGWDMGSDGTLTFAFHSPDGLKRVRITPPATDGFAAWAATAKEVKR